MGLTSPLIELQKAVTAQLETIQTGIVTTFGWRDLPRQATSSNPVINWTPGACKILPVQFASQEPRGLYDLEETFKVYIRSHDVSDPDDESQQYASSLILFGHWANCFYNQVCNRGFIDSFDWNTTVGSEKRRGSQLVVTCRYRYSVTDLIFELGVPELVSAKINQSIGNAEPGTLDISDLPAELPDETTVIDGATNITYIVFEP